MKTFKPNEFAREIGVSIKTLHRWDKANILKAYRTPSNFRFYTQEQLDEYWQKSKKSNTK